MEQVAELVNRARGGEEGAWEVLVRKIYPSGLTQARILLRDRDLAEDALQNALIKVYLHLCSLEEPAAFLGWFRRILMNEVYLILRTRQKDIEGLDPNFILDQQLSLEEHVTLKLEIFQALQVLPLEQQQTFIEVDIRGESLQTVAEAYGLPLGTVKSRLFRAREHLRKELQAGSRSESKESHPQSETIRKGNGNMSELFYDYLEGTMSAEERANFEQQWRDNSEWAQELKRHKDFLTLLHTLTGRLTLSAQEIAEKIQQVSEQIRDYEMYQDQTYFDSTGPKTLTSHIWFKSPEQYRMEASNPLFGETLMTVHGQEMLSYMKTSKQAQRLKFSQEMKRQIGPNFADALKRMAADKNSRVLGTEYIEGRPALHIQFIEKAADQGEMNTHLWLDKDTWMPLVTEQYNSEGKLVLRTLVRELKLNQGIPDAQFVLEIPEDVVIKDEQNREVQPLQEVSAEEASRRFGQPVYLLQKEQLSVTHQWMQISPEQGVLMSQYKRAGEPIAYLTLTQGKVPHHNLPPQIPTESVQFTFDGSEVDGTSVELDLGSVMNMVIWECQGNYFTAGCNGSQAELLSLVQQLTQK